MELLLARKHRLAERLPEIRHLARRALHVSQYVRFPCQLIIFECSRLGSQQGPNVCGRSECSGSFVQCPIFGRWRECFHASSWQRQTPNRNASDLHPQLLRFYVCFHQRNERLEISCGLDQDLYFYVYWSILFVYCHQLAEPTRNGTRTRRQ